MEGKKNIREIRAEEAKKKGVKETLSDGVKKVANGATEAGKWVGDNWVQLSITAGAITAFASKWADIYSKVKGSNTRRLNYQQREDSKLRYYDRSSGNTFYLIRPLTTRETLILQERVRRGEYAGEVLDSMGLLRW